MAVQPGDVIAFAQLAWNVYRLGWADDANASEPLSVSSVWLSVILVC